MLQNKKKKVTAMRIGGLVGQRAGQDEANQDSEERNYKLTQQLI